jgi:hypothetical protein
MDYLRRLLLRSLAVPREQGSSVFDPFAQVAGWEFDAPAPAATKPSSVEPAAATPMPNGIESIAPVAAPLQPAQIPAIEPVLANVPRAQPDRRSEDTAPALPSAPAPVATAGDRSLAPDPAPLAQADAFMRALGMNSVVAPEAPGAPRKVDAPVAPPRAADRPPPAAAQPEAATTPMLVRPALPPAIPAAKPRENPRARTEPPHARHPPAPASAPRPAPPLAAPIERIVQTTVVVAPASRGLDDLAHSSGISRFGIGQS